MRFSGWSSLAISVCSALVFAAPAGAHLSVNPDTVRTGALVDLVFSVPNADDLQRDRPRHDRRRRASRSTTARR